MKLQKKTAPFDLNRGAARTSVLAPRKKPLSPVVSQFALATYNATTYLTQAVLKVLYLLPDRVQFRVGNVESAVEGSTLSSQVVRGSGLARQRF